MSDFQAQRQANIRERDALLKGLQQEAQKIGLYKPTNKLSYNPAPAASTSHKRKRPVPDKKPAADTPRRTSSRIAGLPADSEIARKKAERETTALQEAEWARRRRIGGDQSLGDIVVSGGKHVFSVDVLSKTAAVPYQRTFDAEEGVRSLTSKDLKDVGERMGNLKLWEAWEPGRIKITPERIYSMAFHPSEAKPLVFAGDKTGALGLVDASQPGPGEGKVKKEEDDEEEESKSGIRDRNPGDTDADEEDEEDDADPQITILKPHQRTISAMYTHPATPQTLFTAAYDSSIRGLDLEKSMSTDIYALDDEPVSGVDMADDNPHVLYFTTLNGAFGKHDTRTKPGESTELYQLSEKKIGGFSLNPQAPHYLATASLDRTLRLWDLRKMSRKLPTLVGEHTSRLSVSHAAFNAVGQVATSSYDDSIKIHSFGVGGLSDTTKTKTKTKTATDALEAMTSWKSGYQLLDEKMDPEVVVRHNNQTGRWVTILRPQWQRSPQDGIQKLVIGNMNRFVDVYSASGEQLAQLGGDGISAVPAVAVFHPTKEWIAAGTASGKLCLWM